jgi:branched-chain amino acid transport system ATP-binding protein
MDDTNILEVKGLWKNFGNLAAVAGVDLKFKKKELTAVIGPNGAGKTTLFNLVTGKLKPTQGVVYFNGKNITGLKPYKIARIGIGRIFQITNLFPELTAYENIRVSVLAKRKENKRIFILDKKLKKANEETERIIDLVGLSEKKDIACGVLSHGDQRLIEVGVALAIDPSILLLDEPSGGMGPEETDGMVRFIRELNDKQDITMLLVEHDMSVVFSVAERIVVMHQGMVIADGNPEEIKNNKKVREAYLGEE